MFEQFGRLALPTPRAAGGMRSCTFGFLAGVLVAGVVSGGTTVVFGGTTVVLAGTTVVFAGTTVVFCGTTVVFGGTTVVFAGGTVCCVVVGGGVCVRCDGVLVDCVRCLDVP